MIKKIYNTPHPPLIIKEIGRGREKEIAETINNFNRMAREIEEINPDTIIVISPHAPSFLNRYYLPLDDYYINNMLRFNFNKEIKIPFDKELINKINNYNNHLGIDASPTLDITKDHASYIPLYFILERYKNFKVVLLGMNSNSEEDNLYLGKLINKSINDLKRKAIVIVSGDLSHALSNNAPSPYTPYGKIYDEEIIKIIKSTRLDGFINLDRNLKINSANCAMLPLEIMAGITSNLNLKLDYYSYEAPFGVGYLFASFNVLDPYIELAKLTINKYIKEGTIIDSNLFINEEMKSSRKGTFVSLKINNNLRGCIGTIFPTKLNTKEEIISNAISAATKDPRFNPLREDELDKIKVSVDVLETPTDVLDINELDPKKYGVIITEGFKRGVLLPNLEGIDTVEEQINIAKNKAGITSNTYSLQKFLVTRHEY